MDSKTRCDRKAPCASCVTADVPCRTTNLPPQKRQRVLLSNKYEEAMQDVSQHLQTMSDTLQTLVDRSTSSSPSRAKASVATQSDYARMEEACETNEGFKGDSSFEAYAATAADNLRSPGSSQHASAGLQALRRMPDVAVGMSNGSASTYQAEVDAQTMPPLPRILGLLRLLQREKQRLFYDVPIIDEQEFVGLCKEVCFPTEAYSLSSWIMVNIGLYYLYQALPSRQYAELDITALDVDDYICMLSSNAHTSVHSLRLCLDPSTKTCAALIMLVSRS